MKVSRHLTPATLERVEQVRTLLATGMTQRQACATVGIARSAFFQAVRSLEAGATPGNIGRVPYPDRERWEFLDRLCKRLLSRWRRYSAGEPEWAAVPRPRMESGRLILHPDARCLLKEDEYAALFPTGHPTDVAR